MSRAPIEGDEAPGREPVGEPIAGLEGDWVVLLLVPPLFEPLPEPLLDHPPCG